ncbi:gamma-glutamyltransferase [Amorphus sp. 3PC139-8]|uniref:gamma-glutamyltransferase n=1 Tax=Amorphus sp. 3PC139-8 TaxID=2735676 RepID=UPI00345C734E
MPEIRDPFSSEARPVLEGRRGAVSAAHPLAVAAGQEMLVAGGNAVDAAIAAQAVLCVVAPEACGLGGDMLALVRGPDARITAINGTGLAPAGYQGERPEGANAITVPGIVCAWCEASERFGSLSLGHCLQPAIEIARAGFRIPNRLETARNEQHTRLLEGGAGDWALMGLGRGGRFVQPALADLLSAIGDTGRVAFYQGEIADAIASAVGALGGRLAAEDLAAHETVLAEPNVTRFAGVDVATQPPMTQGILLNMALNGLEQAGALADDQADHAGVELTEAAFSYRARVGEGKALLDQKLRINLERAQRRGGPRAYLHTAGVATSDADGMVVSSLISVFDDFGSCVFVPKGGFVLNDRAAGFGAAPNDPAPSKRPVHTLAPSMVTAKDSVLALATPGADGQVQTLLQVISKIYRDGRDVASAIAAPRWRSENRDLLIERSHPEIAALRRRGHSLKVLDDGDSTFGGLVVAGINDGAPLAGADWRRETWCGVA